MLAAPRWSASFFPGMIAVGMLLLCSSFILIPGSPGDSHPSPAYAPASLAVVGLGSARGEPLVERLLAQRHLAALTCVGNSGRRDLAGAPRTPGNSVGLFRLAPKAPWGRSDRPE